MAGTTVRVLIAETTFSNCVFIHDYPRSSKIEAHFQSNERLYISYYNIISLGTYPSTPKLTQKSKNNASQYPIPDDYIVETEFSERSLICKTKYISVSKVVCYTINWKIGHAEWSVSSTQSSTAVVNTFLQKINSTKSSGPQLFGFDIEPLYHAYITSCSQQNKRFNSFGRDVQKAVDELIVKHKLTNLSGEPILYLQHIGFDCKKNQVCINFKDLNSITIQTKLDAIVHVCDEALLSRDGYRHLAADVPSLFCEYLKILINLIVIIYNSDERASDALVNNYKVGNGLIGDILHIKLGGDGRKEKYETLDKVGKIFALQLADLKENGIIDDDGIHWPIKFYFSGDWKFTYIILGLNAPNSEYFYLFCECDAKSRHNMDLFWMPTGNTKGGKRASLFPVIDLLNYISDELHILLWISDILMECLFRDLFKKNDFEQNFKEKIEKK
ncbi:hypothetical protein GLOIN_2v1875551 [Rhizophagus irregularis DAOM 181602=DAOM 197198]|uniref:Uncharacterized protein n=1 Tax=Rhizophagus irregularis (strain DAOM 181602 / DAOM 197198 / MUCL 43194) TaxID=747089 RepID=A0A2P4Q2Z4_RHIID|nr:hypothetical protein GLOIN_2v1875551 [Rhizophagus irregularis DAOM 181602=DAOM 197198]POG71974.1 hypothetical protein GLOIN_2v1875551 [Rhizophagus irregularis DAOM 181602=DAOM 197198]|eukprot:XP_025178840.1 hypothetical protein GLOIN_2v1875551 [Rhizophagus irregularis DAOM 181602=DAOM 197198]